MLRAALFPLLVAATSGAVPNIVIIVADDYGWNDVGFHGSELSTPQIDALAASGVKLDNYYVLPVCTPTRSALMAARYPFKTGLQTQTISPAKPYGLHLNYSTLADELKHRGFRTHALGKWHLGYCREEFAPHRRGFDTFNGYVNGAEHYFTHIRDPDRVSYKNFTSGYDYYAASAATPPGAPDHGIDWAQNASGAPSENVDPAQGDCYSAHHLSATAAAIIAAHPVDPAAPLFMYLAYQSVHSPYEAPQLYVDEYAWMNDSKHYTPVNAGRPTYGGMVAALDEGVGNVTAALQRKGGSRAFWDNTLLVFTTDNGGVGHGNNWPLRGMKRTLWEGGMRVSAFAHGAGLRKTGYVNEAMVHACDVPESMLALAANGLEADPSDAGGWIGWREHPALKAAAAAEPPFQLGDGIDNWAALATGAPSARTEMIHEAHPSGHGQDDGNGQAIRVGDYKLITEKGPMWHGPPNDEWYESGSNPAQYSHTVSCGGPPPNASAPGYCDPAKLPCLFNVRLDPCEFRDLSKDRPDVVANLTARLAVYQATAVHKSFHQLKGVNCSSSDPKDHPEWDGFWQPNCQGVESGRRRRARAALN